MALKIRQATRQAAAWRQDSFQPMGSRRPEDHLANCCRQQDEGKLVLLVTEESM